MAGYSICILPSDAILNSLYSLDVQDILRAERTCKKMQDVVSTRHLWLVKLRSLDLTCAPDLPPHIKVESLSYSQLREIVVNAVRFYSRRVKKSLKYEIRNTITIDDPTPGFAKPGYYGRDIVRLSPGGRYLFIFILPDRNIKIFDDRGYFIREESIPIDHKNTLKIIDLHHNNSCVWMYTAAEISQGYDRVKVIEDFCFEVCQDGSITVGIVGANLFKCEELYEIHRLGLLPNDSNKMMSTKVYSKINESYLKRTPGSIFVYGNYVGFGVMTSSYDRMTIVDWETGFSHSLIIGSGARSEIDSIIKLNVWKGHLFYVASSIKDSDILSLYVIKLDRLFGAKKEEYRMTSFGGMAFDDMDRCSLLLSDLDKYDPRYVTVSHLSVCDLSWKFGLKTEVMNITIGTKNKSGLYRLSHIQYDPSVSEVGELVLRDDPLPMFYDYFGDIEDTSINRAWEREAYNFIRNFSNITSPRNCLCLLGDAAVNRKDKNKEWRRSVGILGIDHNSELLFSNLPSQFVSFVEEGEDGDIWDNRGKDERQLILFAEGYSGALVCISKDFKSINLWYPA